MKSLMFVPVLLMLAVPTFAQTPATNARQHVSWDQDVTDTGASLADVRTYIYRGYVDGAVAPNGTVLVNVTCVAGGTTADPFVCSASWPALVPGAHSMAITAGNSTGETLPSKPLAFTFQVVIPNIPKNVRPSP